MFSHPAPAESQTLTDQQAADAQYYRRVLHRLIEIGADLAGLLHQQAQAGTPAVPPAAAPMPDAAIAFDRIARAIRRTITLARKVAEPVVGVHPDQHRAAARRRIIREVEDAIQRTTQAADAEPLHAELLDRLDAPDLDDDIAQRPAAAIIADICRDLGLAALPGTHPWKRRTAADVTALCARAAQASALFARPIPPHTNTGSDPPSISTGGSAAMSHHPPPSARSAI